MERERMSMGSTRDTKGMFADELEKMMEHVPLSKVRVVDLCERCGVERRVFYYHFKDKYDLVAWMFERDYSSAADGHEPYSEELYAKIHRKLLDRRNFYRRAFEEDSQNSIWRYLVQFSATTNEHALMRYLGVPKLSHDFVFMARHFAYGNVGCVVDWLSGRLETTPEQLAADMFACIPAILRDAYTAQSEFNPPL